MVSLQNLNQNSYQPVQQQLSYNNCKVAIKQENNYSPPNNDLLIIQQQGNDQSTINSQYQQTCFIDQVQQQSTNFPNQSVCSIKNESNKFDLNLVNTPPPSPEQQNQLKNHHHNSIQQQHQNVYNTDYRQQSYLNNNNQQWTNGQIIGSNLNNNDFNNTSNKSKVNQSSKQQDKPIVHQYVHLNSIVINSLNINNGLQINNRNNSSLSNQQTTHQVNQQQLTPQQSNNNYQANPLYIYTHQVAHSNHHLNTGNYSTTQAQQPNAQQLINQSNSPSNNISNQINQPCQSNNFYSPSNQIYQRSLEDNSTIHSMTPMNPQHIQQTNQQQAQYYEQINSLPSSEFMNQQLNTLHTSNSQSSNQQSNAQYGTNSTNIQSNQEYNYVNDLINIGQVDELNNNVQYINNQQCSNNQRSSPLTTTYTPNIANVSNLPVKLEQQQNDHGYASLESLVCLPGQMEIDSNNYNPHLINNTINNQLNDNKQIMQMNTNLQTNELPIQAAAVSTTKSRRGRKTRGPKKVTQHHCSFDNCKKVYTKSSHLKAHLR